MAQPGLGNASNMELSLDHDISFSNQFSDLINDFISVEGRRHHLRAPAGVRGRHSTLAVGGWGPCPFTQAEMCIPCCSPQQGLQLSSAEAGPASWPTCTSLRWSRPPRPRAPGDAAAGGRVFMVTDYSRSGLTQR